MKNLKQDELNSLKELESIQDELEKRKQSNPSKYYVPNLKCEEFVKLMDEDGFIYVFSAGNGAGKTAGGVNIIANMLLGTQNKWFDLPLYHKFKAKPRRGRIVSTAEGIAKVINPELKKWLPAHRFVRRKMGKMFYSQYQIGANTFDLLTTDQEITQFEGATLDWLWIDEPCSEAIFNACVARFRFGGKIILTMTPLAGSAWIYDKIFSGKNVKIVYADIFDNCIENNCRGILRKKDIDRMVSQYDADEKDARIHGRFVHLRGLVYKEFTPGVHTIPRFAIPKHWPRFMAIDPHDRKPNAMGWAALDPAGDLYFYAEDFSTDLTKNTVQRIIDIEREYGKPQRRMIDPNFGLKRYGNTGRTVQQEYEIESRLQGYPMRFAPANDDIPAGHKKVKGLLHYDKNKPIDERNHPKVYFFSDLKHTIYGMTHYMYDEDKTGKDTKAVQERPQGKWKDMPDVARYLIMDNPSNRTLQVHRPAGGMY